MRKAMTLWWMPLVLVAGVSAQGGVKKPPVPAKAPVALDRVLDQELHATLFAQVGGDMGKAVSTLRSTLAKAKGRDKLRLQARLVRLLGLLGRQDEARALLKELATAPAPYGGWAKAKLGTDRAKGSADVDPLQRVMDRLELGTMHQPDVKGAIDSLFTLGLAVNAPLLQRLPGAGPFGRANILQVLIRIRDNRKAITEALEILFAGGLPDKLLAAPYIHLSANRLSLIDRALKENNDLLHALAYRALSGIEGQDARLLAGMLRLVEKGGSSSIDSYILEALGRASERVGNAPGCLQVAKALMRKSPGLRGRQSRLVEILKQVLSAHGDSNTAVRNQVKAFLEAHIQGAGYQPERHYLPLWMSLLGGEDEMKLVALARRFEGGTPQRGQIYQYAREWVVKVPPQAKGPFTRVFMVALDDPGWSVTAVRLLRKYPPPDVFDSLHPYLIRKAYHKNYRTVASYIFGEFIKRNEKRALETAIRLMSNRACYESAAYYLVKVHGDLVASKSYAWLDWDIVDRVGPQAYSLLRDHCIKHGRPEWVAGMIRSLTAAKAPRNSSFRAKWVFALRKLIGPECFRLLFRFVPARGGAVAGDLHSARQAVASACIRKVTAIEDIAYGIQHIMELDRSVAVTLLAHCLDHVTNHHAEVLCNMVDRALAECLAQGKAATRRRGSRDRGPIAAVERLRHGLNLLKKIDGAPVFNRLLLTWQKSAGLIPIGLAGQRTAMQEVGLHALAGMPIEAQIQKVRGLPPQGFNRKEAVKVLVRQVSPELQTKHPRLAEEIYRLLLDAKRISPSSVQQCLILRYGRMAKHHLAFISCHPDLVERFIQFCFSDPNSRLDRGGTADGYLLYRLLLCYPPEERQSRALAILKRKVDFNKVSGYVVKNLIGLLDRQDHSALVTILVPFLSHPSQTARLEVVRVLSRLFSIHAYPPLIQALRDGNKAVRDAAREALKELDFYLEAQDKWRKLQERNKGKK